MVCEHTSTRKIEFSETDMAGLVHFSNFFKYMETAERDFFAAAGVDLIKTKPGELVGWPRARAECKFAAPFASATRSTFILAVKSMKDRSIDYQFRIYIRNEDGSRTHAAKGHMTTVLAELDPMGHFNRSNCPRHVRAKINEAPAQALKRAQ